MVLYGFVSLQSQIFLFDFFPSGHTSLSATAPSDKLYVLMCFDRLHSVFILSFTAFSTDASVLCLTVLIINNHYPVSKYPYASEWLDLSGSIMLCEPAGWKSSHVVSARKRKPRKERDSMSCVVPVWTICPDLEMTAALQCPWRHHKGKWGHKLMLWLGYGNFEGQPILQSHNNKLHFLFFVTFVSSSYWIKKPMSLFIFSPDIFVLFKNNSRVRLHPF